jgi:hypothetical protein
VYSLRINKIKVLTILAFLTGQEAKCGFTVFRVIFVISLGSELAFSGVGLKSAMAELPES